MKHKEKLYFPEEKPESDGLSYPKPMWYYKMYGISTLYEAKRSDYRGIVFCNVLGACITKCSCGRKKCHDFQQEEGKLLCKNQYKLYEEGKKIHIKVELI
jgi:hypothetical protein